MLHDGLDVDEGGRLAFDGAFLQVPGAGGGAGFNSRFVQPTRHPSMLEEHDFPSDAFPFTTAPSRDPVTGRTASYLDHAADAQGRLPKLIFANTSTEFWNRDASLIGTTPDGSADVRPTANARLYAFMGAQHYVGRSPVRAPFVNCVSTTDHYLPMRALILALDRWSGGAAPPPPSAYPVVADGTLVSVDAYRAAFPALAITPPLQVLAEPRLDFGPGFATAGVAERIPPGHGWNARAPETGFAWATARFDGSFLPFARTEAERRALGDPRPSLETRYPTRGFYEASVRAAAAAQVAAGFLLPEDLDRAVQENLGLYDRILAHDPKDQRCRYLFGE
jgi:hypothetical protein